MMRTAMMAVAACIAPIALATACGLPRAYALSPDRLPWLAHGAQVDPGFAYYKDRSPESIADEIAANGYKVVHYVVTNDATISEPLVAAFRKRGIGVWYLTFGNGTYSTTGLPEGWEKWRMVTRSDLAGKPLNDGYTRFCLNNPDYRAWKKASMAAVLRKHRFLGVEIAEPHWPEYPGITAPAYACFCGHCKAAFRKAYPEEPELPDILDPASDRHPDRNPSLWRKWLTFRASSLNAFLNDLVNGRGGLRATSPGRKVCTWTLALLGPEGMRRVLEDSGEDAAEVVRIVKPDVHCLQTHWPDWLRADLKGDYVLGYRPFLDGIRKVAPKQPVIFQGDIGSQKQNRRSWEWIREFERACDRMGAQGSQMYEYFIGGYIYDDPPRIAAATRSRDTVRLSFTKRLDRASAGVVSAYALSRGTVQAVTVDGSVVTLRIVNAPPSVRLNVTVRNIRDASDRRLFDDRPPKTLREQTVTICPVRAPRAVR
ncbi:MAG: N-acyl-D-glucosamine 2-epimerase [Armatimonadetes bacterium]|nr:N-acyl-D-glucosamine 2-epimerase [Armatimonadota bacterium]